MTERWVLDCSFTAALILPDKSSSLVQAFFLNQATSELWVPALWWYETSNVLSVAERKRILTMIDVEKAISLWGQLTLRTDRAESPEHIRRLCEITRLYGLSAYDASYLELAIRQRAALASLDRQLLDAAVKSGIETWQ